MGVGGNISVGGENEPRSSLLEMNDMLERILHLYVNN